MRTEPQGRRARSITALGKKEMLVHLYAIHPGAMWNADPLLGSDREISNYTMAVTRQWPINRNRGTVFSVQSMLRC
jgi:hypothetical protein